MSSQLISELKEAIGNQQAVCVIGSGVTSATCPNKAYTSWTGLLKSAIPFCESFSDIDQNWIARVNSDIDSGDLDDLLSAAHKISRKLNAPSNEFSNWLTRTIGSLVPQDKSLIQAIHSLGLPILTTNYDSLIEQVTGLQSFTWQESNHVQKFLRGEKYGVFHLHGHWQTPSSIILDISSYERITSNVNIQDVMKTLFMMKSIIWVGSNDGIRDPHFSKIIKYFKSIWPGTEHRHYVLTRNSEVCRIRSEYKIDTRVTPVGYGNNYSDLTPFVKSLKKNNKPNTQKVNLKLDDLLQNLRKLNSYRVDAHVGDKYQHSLYVKRKVEQQLKLFINDPRHLATQCAEKLNSILTASSIDLAPKEIKIVQKTHHAFQSGYIVENQESVAELSIALEPKNFTLIEKEFDKFRAYVFTESSSLYTNRLSIFKNNIEKLINSSDSKCEVHAQELLYELEQIWKKITEKESKNKTNHTQSYSDETVVVAKSYISIVSRKSNKQDKFSAIKSMLSKLEKKIQKWGHTRIVAEKTIKSRRSKKKENIISGDIIRISRGIIDVIKRQCMVVVDVAGSGKTNMLAELGTHDNWNVPVILLFAKTLESSIHVIQNALDQAASELGFTTFDALLDQYECILEENYTYIMVGIDGINEYSNDEYIKNSIRSSVSKYAQRRVRFLVTCRDIYWAFFKDAFSDSKYKISLGSLRRYSDSEFQEALKKYFIAYQLEGITIEAGAREAFRSPILLRFFCEAYGSKDPMAQKTTTIRKVRSINLKHLFDDYMEAKLAKMSEQSLAKKDLQPIKEKEDMRAIIFTIAELMLEKKIVRINTEDLDTYSTARATAYNLLLDEDILIEERDGHIYFVYEAFMEYIMAYQFTGSHKDKTSEEIIRLAVNHSYAFKNMRGTLLMILIIFAEDRGISLMDFLYSEYGSKWTDVILAAIGQLKKEAINNDAILVLKKIILTEKTEFKNHAAALLFLSGKANGTNLGFELLYSNNSQVSLTIKKALSKNANTLHTKRLINDLLQGNRIAEETLLQITPTTRSLKYFKKALETANPNQANIIFSCLANSKVNFKLIAEIASPYTCSTQERVKSAALRCLETTIYKKKQSEITRHRIISRSLQKLPTPHKT